MLIKKLQKRLIDYKLEITVVSCCGGEVVQQ